MVCIQDCRLPGYKNRQTKASRAHTRTWTDGWIHADTLGREMSGRESFAEQTNEHRALPSREQGLFDREKLRRISNCDRCLYVEGLAAGLLREVKGDTDCISIATGCLFLSLPLSFHTLALNTQLLIDLLYKRAWYSSWNNKDTFLFILPRTETPVEYLR